MVKEENLNKILYKVFINVLKIIPILVTFIHILNTILFYFNIDMLIFSFLGGMSFLSLIFFYIASIVFKFCLYHRLFIYYLFIVNTLNCIDFYYNIPLSNTSLYILYSIITGIFLFLILYSKLNYERFYKKRSNKNIKEYNR